MSKQPKRLSKQNVLRYTNSSRASVHKVYARYWQVQNLPIRCDNNACGFYTGKLEWNGQALPVILDHINGVNSDNRPENLRYLCPNCDALLDTRGGKNRGRVQKSSGGFSIRRLDGTRDYTLPGESGDYRSR